MLLCVTMARVLHALSFSLTILIPFVCGFCGRFFHLELQALEVWQEFRMP